MGVGVERNQPCWCGSGIKAKKCHAHRQRQRPVGPAELRNLLFHQRPQSRCLSAAAPKGCSSIVRAHTVPRSAVLKQVADDSHHVLTLRPGIAGGRQIARVGLNVASTFRGFCGAHDAAIFAPIERDGFTGTPEQTFLVAYRALCHELFQKQAAALALPRLRDQLDRGKPPREQQRIQAMISLHAEGSELGLRESVRVKARADRTYLSKRFEDWGSAIYRLEGRLRVAAAGAASPSYDMRGQMIQDLGDLSTPVQTVMFGLVPNDENSNNLVFSWPPESTTMSRLMLMLHETPTDRLAEQLLRFTLAHVENCFFSQEWWSSLSLIQQHEFLRVSAVITPDDERDAFQGPVLARWKAQPVSFRLPGLDEPGINPGSVDWSQESVGG